jgi:hypothetical protein
LLPSDHAYCCRLLLLLSTWYTTADCYSHRRPRYYRPQRTCCCRPCDRPRLAATMDCCCRRIVVVDHGGLLPSTSDWILDCCRRSVTVDHDGLLPVLIPSDHASLPFAVGAAGLGGLLSGHGFRQCNRPWIVATAYTVDGIHCRPEATCCQLVALVGFRKWRHCRYCRVVNSVDCWVLLLSTMAGGDHGTKVAIVSVQFNSPIFLCCHTLDRGDVSLNLNLKQSIVVVCLTA